MNNTYFEELYGLVTRVQKRKEAEALLFDLLTPKERASVAERVQILKRLIKGVPQRKISSELKVSISKVIRGSHALKKSRGGLKSLLNKA